MRWCSRERYEDFFDEASEFRSGSHIEFRAFKVLQLTQFVDEKDSNSKMNISLNYQNLSKASALPHPTPSAPIILYGIY